MPFLFFEEPFAIEVGATTGTAKRSESGYASAHKYRAEFAASAVHSDHLPTLCDPDIDSLWFRSRGSIQSANRALLAR